MSKHNGVVRCVFNIFEPVYIVVCVLPLVHVRFNSHVAIDIFNYLFPHFAQLRFAWVDKPACWFVPVIFIMIFECNERFSLGCYIYSITEAESFCYPFILHCSLPDCSFFHLISYILSARSLLLDVHNAELVVVICFVSRDE